MPREIELKLRVASHDAVRQALGDRGATLVRRGVETNRIYDRRDGSLRRKGYGLRVRSVVCADGADLPAVLTVKGPRAPGVLKSRQEWETTIGSAETMHAMLAALGFAKILEYEKRRESWRLGDCLVELDGPPHIGLFVEIEGPTERVIERTRRDLGLAGAEAVADSYPKLMMDYCQEHGIVDRVVALP